MASKVPVSKQAVEQNQEEQSTALASIPSASALMNIDPPAPSADELLPQFKIPYSIEVDGEKIKKGDAFTAGLYDGKVFTQLAVPYVMTVLAARKASRKLITKTGPDGAETKEYERGFIALGENNASDAVYKMHEQDSTAQMGNSYVVAILQGEAVCIAELPAFKLMKDYLGRPLYQANAQARHGLRVDLKDHDANLTASKANPQNKYLDPGKFKQHQIVDLTEDQARLIGEAIKANKSRFDSWVRR
jgi:hypothetical protein